MSEGLVERLRKAATKQHEAAKCGWYTAVPYVGEVFICIAPSDLLAAADAIEQSYALGYSRGREAGAKEVWLPIEMAPKDGTVIVLRAGDWCVAGYWNLAPGVYGPDKEHPWTFLQPTAIGEYAGLNGFDERTVTHWHPLTEPPA